MASEIAKRIILEELQEQAHPEAVEDVIFWALQAYNESRVEYGNTWGRVCAGAIIFKIKEAEAKEAEAKQK